MQPGSFLVNKRWSLSFHSPTRLMPSRLGFCFKYRSSKKSIVSRRQRQGVGNSREETLPLATSSVETRNTEDILSKSSGNMRMDLHPTAPFASSSSFPSAVGESQPPLDEIQFAYYKLQSLSHDQPVLGNSPPSGGARYSSPHSHNGDPGARPWMSAASISGSHDRPRSVGPYFSPNKIAYRGPSAGPSPPVTTPGITPCLTTLQELVQKTGVKTGPSKSRDCQSVDPSTVRLLNKLKNLDEILRNLDDSLLCKKFTVASKMSAPQLEDAQTASLAKLLERSSSASQSGPVTERPKSVRMSPPDVLRSSSSPHTVAMLTPGIIPNLMSRSDLKQQMERQVAGKLGKQWPEMENAWPESGSSGGSSGGTHAPQSFATPIMTRAKEDVPLLLSRYANTKSATTLSSQQAGLMKEMVSRVDFLERQMARSIECIRGVKQRRRCMVRRRSSGKKVVVMMQKQLLSSFQLRLARTDAVVRGVKRQLATLLNQQNLKQLTPTTDSMLRNGLHEIRAAVAHPILKSPQKSSSQDSAEIVGAKDSESFRRIMKSLEEKYSVLSSENQQLAQGTEGIEKQCREHSVEIELCWSAINQLCIDNEVFRNELRQRRASPSASQRKNNMQKSDGAAQTEPANPSALYGDL